MKIESNNLSLELGENKDYLEDFLNTDVDEISIDLTRMQKIVQSFASDLQAFRQQGNGSQKEAQKIERYSELLTRALAKIDFLQKQKERERGEGDVFTQRSNLS